VPEPALSASDEGGFAESWRAGVEAGLRYWGTFGRLALESASALLPLVAELRPGSSVTPAIAATRALPPTILVEAEAGQSGMGVFLVENTTAEQLSIPVHASPFRDSRGREVSLAVAFRPDTITLDPGDQQVVQVAAAVDESLEPDVRYRALISVPGLSETQIPIVVRRRPGAALRTRRRAKAATPAS
jgi:hypothetical protein